MTEKQLYDPTTTADQVLAASIAVRKVVDESGLTANVLHTMFSFMATQMMNEIVRRSEETLKEQMALQEQHSRTAQNASHDNS